jgi:hypothetical protein
MDKAVQTEIGHIQNFKVLNNPSDNCIKHLYSI